MATSTYSYSAYEPAHVHHSQACTCLTCGMPWDSEDNDDEIEYIDGEIYCNGDCANNANADSFRRDAGEILLSHEARAREEIEAACTCYPCEIDEPGHPYALLDDLKLRAGLFALGTDTGFRAGGLLMDISEMFALRALLRDIRDVLQPDTDLHRRVVDQLDLTDTIETRTEHGGAL